MIDVAVGLGAAAGPWWVGPALTTAVAIRPRPAFELRVADTTAPRALGRWTADGREIGRCFCDGTVDRIVGADVVTVGVFPFREEVRGWTLDVGLRVGGGVARDVPGWYYVFEDGTVDTGDDPSKLLPAWTLEAVATASAGRLGVQIGVEQLTWVDLAGGYGDGEVGRVLSPRVEGFVRW